MNTKRTLLRTLLFLGALAGMAVGSADAQIAFRSSSSAFISGGGAAIPTLRAASRAGVAPTIIGTSRAPASDDAVGTATGASITPPAGMQAGDLIIIWVTANIPSATTFTNTNTGGQGNMTIQQGLSVGANPKSNVYVSIFNGTWTGNPAWSWGSTPVTYQILMAVVRGGSPITVSSDVFDGNGSPQASDTNLAAPSAAPASPFNVTIPAASYTTNTDNALLFAQWVSADNNAWALQTPGWTNLGGQPQWRSMAAAGGAGADSSTSVAYLTQASAGPVPAVTNQQTSQGGDAGAWRMIAIKPYALQKPPGTVAGDVMIATIGVALDTITITPPAGWTLVRRIFTPSTSKTGFY